MTPHQDRVLNWSGLLLYLADSANALLRQTRLVGDADDFQPPRTVLSLERVQVPDRRTTGRTFRVPEVEQHQAALPVTAQFPRLAVEIGQAEVQTLADELAPGDRRAPF